MTCFVDTSALLAVLDRDDERHAEAEGTWQRLMAEKSTLLTTNYVLLETVAILQSRVGMPAVRIFSDDIMPVLTVDWVAAQEHDKGMGAFLAADRRKLSLVDCISFDAMRRRGLRLAFAFDSHFQEQGFVSP
ncbi:MAG: twitching motility protein PilT [Lentisphaerae bacterium RIFOXYB12_FULL_65_16]|nr:MAG: twitching motility protein PilT [Lentisphaerae bacterium RIFOXYA12_64_32]OGV93253.1 MAG: twitching motility protein PilT [Lentisphaerae bacterium RIFOXYB12_FULL_65_16]